METLIRDVRFGLKLLLKERTFAATVLLTLAVCIGANVAIYSVIHTVLLEPLPFDESDRLMTVYNSYPAAGAPRGSSGTVDFFQRRENIPAFEEVALFQPAGSTVGEAGSAERVRSLRVTPSFFPLLRVEPAMGRAFTEDEMVEGNQLKVILTDAYWREVFGADPQVLGKEMRISGRPHEVVGVLAPGFEMPGAADTRFVVPIAFTDRDHQLDAWHSNNFGMLARLAPGATIEQAVAQNDALNRSLIEQWPVPNAKQILEDAGYHTVVVGAQDELVRDIKPVLYLLWGGVALVLLIGCVNIANLMLARAQSRVGEVATKLALGAPRVRVARQILTETVVMGVVGGALGIGLGAVGLRLLLGMGVEDLPRGTAIAIDGPVLAFTLVLAVGAGLLFGAIPMAQIMRGDLTPVFRTEGRTGTASRRAVWTRNALVTSQVALAFVLLIGAGLLLMSFRAALSVDPGFEPDRVMTGYVALSSIRYETEEQRRQFWDELLTEVRALPGVEAASLTAQLPFTGNNSSSVIIPEGYVPPPGESILSPYQNLVGTDYFAAMGIELLEGREFLESDGPDVPNVMIVDEWLARRYWPDRSPVGERMVDGQGLISDSIGPDNLYAIIGVVRTIKQNELTAPASEHVGAYYFPYRQQVPGTQALVVRTATEAAAITPALRDVVRRLDGELPLFGTETMTQRIDDSLQGRKVPLMLLGVFAGVALFLAVVGIYGSLAYSVGQRRKEIGIRMAMGSAPEDVFKSVVRQGMRVTAMGLAVGIAAALLVTRTLQSVLFGIEAADPRVMAAVAVALALVGLAACVVPARKATAVDPVSALGS
ncbi:MAG: ABC transporter permease [Longimicrobiales bacterium]